MKDLVIILVSGLIGLLAFLVVRWRLPAPVQHHNFRCVVVNHNADPDAESEYDMAESLRRLNAELSKAFGEIVISSSLASDRWVNYTWSGLMESSVEIYRRDQA